MEGVGRREAGKGRGQGPGVHLSAGGRAYRYLIRSVSCALPSRFTDHDGWQSSLCWVGYCLG